MNSPSRPARRTVIQIGMALLATGTLTACSGAESGSSTAATGGADQTDSTADPTSDPEEASASATPRAQPTTIVATSVVSALKVFGEPEDLDEKGETGAPEQTLDRSERVTGQVVLLALDVGKVWTKVQLPVRPNGSTGWVRSDEVTLSGHNFNIDIDLGGHEIVVTDGDREVTRSAIGVGRADRPTPGGEYFITELLQPPDPSGLYGPYAYGLSGYSDVLMDFRGGKGVIGIHGTNEPDLVGTDVSSGCIRLPNKEIVRLVEAVGVPLGTPVTIRA